MTGITKYTSKITSAHNDKPKFMAMVEATVQPIIDVLEAARKLPACFDLDEAIGVQLDAVGLWVGASRYVAVPLEGVYFAFDIDGVGFDQGTWQGQFDSDTGMTILNDESYRLLIAGKIGANHWDGTLAQTRQILEMIFKDDLKVFIQDNQDMSMTVGIAGRPPTSIELALITGGHIPLKPQAVKVKFYIASQAGGALFGFDLDNQYVSGFDKGSWGKVYN